MHCGKLYRLVWFFNSISFSWCSVKKRVVFKTRLTNEFGERVGQFSAIGNDEPNTDFLVWLVHSSFLWEIRIILYSPCHNTISVLHFIFIHYSIIFTTLVFVNLYCLIFRIFSHFASVTHRQSHSGQLMTMTMIQMTIIATMKSCSPQLMRWILLFSLWIQWKVCQKNLQFIIAIIVVVWHADLFKIKLFVVLQSSDPARFESLSKTLEFNYQALANGVAQHAEQRRVEIEKERLEKATAAATAS